MGHTAHAIFSVDSWHLDHRFLSLLQDFFRESELEAWKIGLRSKEREIWSSLDKKINNKFDLPLDLMPEAIYINAVKKDDVFFDFNIDANLTTDCYGTWPVSFYSSTKVAVNDMPQGFFSRFARKFHLKIRACKSFGYTTHSEFNEDAYGEIVKKYGKDDLVFHPDFDYVIINPADYDEGILDILRDIHFIWADARGVPRPDPFPREIERLENGHLFLSLEGEL